MFLFQRDVLLRPASASFSERRSVRFQDIDAAGIIFYPRVLEYFHDAYVSFLSGVGFPLPEVLRERSWLSPVRHAEADFMKPMRFGDEIAVGLVCAHAEATEVTLGYRIVRIDPGEVTAVGQVVHTFLDPGTFKRAPIPVGLVRAYAALGDGSGP